MTSPMARFRAMTTKRPTRERAGSGVRIRGRANSSKWTGSLTVSSLDTTLWVARVAFDAVLLGAALLLVILWYPAPKMDA